MQNLAGVAGCDEQITRELREAGIDLVWHERRSRGEVPWSVSGELNYGEYRFARAWYYWVVTGRTPLETARQLWETDKTIRPGGHCAPECVEDHADPQPEFLEWLIEQRGHTGEMAELIRGSRRVPAWHIDTQEGLNLFAAAVSGRKKG